MSLAKEIKQEVISKFKTHEGDTGSAEVQIALLSTRINGLTEHFKTHVKDHSSRRGLIMLVNQRRRHLKYLKKTNQKTYSKIVQELNIRG